MTTQEIVNKLWNLCNVLRDDGITYHQYLTELTFILFLKMSKEKDSEKDIPEGYRWDDLIKREGADLKQFYRQLLLKLGDEGKGKIKQIFTNAQTFIDEPRNLKKIITSIDNLDWYSAKHEGLGDMYEGLLEKNANEKKSGAGQYFTPRPLIDVMVQLTAPQPGELCNDPACGTFGFMIAVDHYLRKHTDDYYNPNINKEFQLKTALSGCELVADAHRLALMNASLHDLDSNIYLGDTLSEFGKQMNGFDVVLTNPPFGTKKGGERPSRDDLPVDTSNKQLNFVQHIYGSLKKNGKSRAAVVLPDNVLFQDGDGQKVRRDLMNKCRLHTILRLPTGIFYAQGVKTNVLFFERGTTDKDNTSEVWFYDLRTNMQSFGKTNMLTREHFNDFVAAYTAEDRNTITDNRFAKFTRSEIAAKNDSLDLGLIADDKLADNDNMPEPIDLANEAKAELLLIMKNLDEMIKELK